MDVTSIDWKKIFDKSSITVFIWTDKGEVLYVSNSIEQYGYNPEDFTTGKLKYKELISGNNISDPYNVWFCELGGEIGWMVVTRSAENSVGFYTQATQYREEMGDEFSKLWAEFSPLLKRFEHKNGMPRPEFTYKPAE